MAAPKEVLEGQAATTKQALEGQAATLNETLKEVLEEQAATTKQALEALKEALTDNRATWPFPVSTVDWNQLEQSWAAVSRAINQVVALLQTAPCRGNGCWHACACQLLEHSVLTSMRIVRMVVNMHADACTAYAGVHRSSYMHVALTGPS